MNWKFEKGWSLHTFAYKNFGCVRRINKLLLIVAYDQLDKNGKTNIRLTEVCGLF